MSYTAIHYVNVAGLTYVPGENIQAIYDEEKKERLLRIGAVIDNGDNMPFFPPCDGDKSDADASEMNPGSEEAPETEEEFAEEAEVEEIDAMGDIMPAAEEAAEEPEKKPRRGGRRA